MSGRSLSCARTREGDGWCWGANDVGQLGVFDTEDSTAPRRALLPIDAIDLSAADDQTCAVTSDGRAWCWGGNDYGEVGVDTDAQTRPAALPMLDAVDVAVCVAELRGGVVCRSPERELVTGSLARGVAAAGRGFAPKDAFAHDHDYANEDDYDYENAPESDRQIRDTP